MPHGSSVHVTVGIHLAVELYPCCHALERCSCILGGWLPIFLSHKFDSASLSVFCLSSCSNLRSPFYFVFLCTSMRVLCHIPWPTILYILGHMGEFLAMYFIFHHNVFDLKLIWLHCFATFHSCCKYECLWLYLSLFRYTCLKHDYVAMMRGFNVFMHQVTLNLMHIFPRCHMWATLCIKFLHIYLLYIMSYTIVWTVLSSTSALSNDSVVKALSMRQLGGAKKSTSYYSYEEISPYVSQLSQSSSATMCFAFRELVSRDVLHPDMFVYESDTTCCADVPLDVLVLHLTV